MQRSDDERRQAAAQSPLRPRHVQVRETLEARLASGFYPVDSLLPTELELAREFDASRFTIREALRHLQAQGYVERRQRVGTRVVSNRAQVRYALTVASLEELFQIESDARFEIFAETTLTLDAELARLVGGEEGEAWVRVEGIRYAMPDDLPLGGVDAWLPEPLAGRLPMLRLSREPWFTVLERDGAGAIERTVQEISAAPLPARVARRLGRPPESCALRLLRRYVTQGGVIFAAVNWHPAEDMTFVMEVHRTDMPG